MSKYRHDSELLNRREDVLNEFSHLIEALDAHLGEAIKAENKNLTLRLEMLLADIRYDCERFEKYF